MKYGKIAGNRHINSFIYRCFEYICEDDQKKFVKMFREQPHESAQIMHTFRELILGAYLSFCGFQVRYHHMIKGKTPDWCILDDKQTVIGIVELTNFHIDAATNSEIETQRKVKNIVAYWRDGNKNNVNRLYDNLHGKASKYKIMFASLGIPYIIALFSQFEVPVYFVEEFCPCFTDSNTGLFKEYPQISGALYFEENGGRYIFRYIANSNATQKLIIPDGIFPSAT